METLSLGTVSRIKVHFVRKRSTAINGTRTIIVASDAISGPSTRLFYRARVTAYYSNDEIIEGVYLRTITTRIKKKKEEKNKPEREGGGTMKSLCYELIIVRFAVSRLAVRNYFKSGVFLARIPRLASAYAQVHRATATKIWWKSADVTQKDVKNIAGFLFKGRLTTLGLATLASAT